MAVSSGSSLIAWDESLCVPQVIALPGRFWEVLESYAVKASSDLFIPGAFTCKGGGRAMAVSCGSSLICWDESLCVPQVMGMPGRFWQVLESCAVKASSHLFIPGALTCKGGGRAMAVSC
jgi:hypothetical protein